MAFDKRREYLFLYSVKDANPNGDPLNENHPRYDGDTAQAMASDVRIKRTIRDEWVRLKEPVLVDGQAKSLKTRFEELKKSTGQTFSP
jgi:CRISPR-associated protein Csh2